MGVLSPTVHSTALPCQSCLLLRSSRKQESAAVEPEGSMLQGCWHLGMQGGAGSRRPPWRAAPAHAPYLQQEGLHGLLPHVKGE